MKLRTIVTLAGKNLFDSLKDPKVILLGFLAPLLLVFLMGSLFNFEVRLDRSYKIGYYVDPALSFDIEKLNPYGFFVLMQDDADSSAIKEKLDKGTYAGFIDIRPSMGTAQVTFYRSSKNTIMDSVLSGVIRAATEKESLSDAYVGALRARGIPTLEAAEIQRAAESEVKVAFKDARIDGKGEDNKYTRFAIGMAGMFLLFTGLFESVFKILEEKKDKVFNRYQIYGITNGEILVAKLVSIFLMLIIILSLFFASTALFLGVSIGAALRFCLVCCLYSFMIATMSLMLSILLKRSSDVQTILMPMILVLSLLGGFWIPLENLSSVLQRASLFLPTGAFMTTALRAANGAAVDSSLALSMAVLAAYSVIFIAISLRKIDFIQKEAA